jgi:hypothetical protein
MADTPDKPNEAPSEPTPAAAADTPVSDLASQAPEAQQPRPEGVPLGAEIPPGIRKRRRRRRRHGPPPAGADQPSASAVESPTPPAGEPVSGAPTPPDAPPSPTSDPLSANATSDRPRKRRRRRRRKKPPEGTAAAGLPVGGTEAHVATAVPAENLAQRDERPPRRPWRERPPRQGRGREGRDERPREGGPRGAGSRKPDHRSKGRGPGGPDRPHGRGREDRDKKPPQKLYSSESVVDHGYEDIPAAEGTEARRVDWTIVKRTVADQRTTQTISTVYILKRDGVVTEFPFLAAAREAVNKKIAHPEKLTRPKGDYAAIYTKK